VKPRGAIVICCALTLFAGLPVTASARLSTSRGRADEHRPNILILISDDQAWSDFSPTLMPAVYSQLVDQGVLFKRAYVNTPLCCPSRSQILTGLYEHHTGVDTNTVPLERPTIVQALHGSGYRTMLAGKYLNSWPCTPRAEFDRWACVGTPTPSTYSMIDPVINEDGAWTRYVGYQTDILAGQLVDFIHSTPDTTPFFAMYSPTTPHLPSDDPRYDDVPITPPHGPSFDEDTLTAHAPLYERRPPLSEREITAADERFTKMSHGVRSLDDSVGTILHELGDRSRDTLVVYLSDNGFLFGEHRRFGKTDAYEESVGVPMVVRFPALLPTGDAYTSHALVSNVDIAPTIAELAGLTWGSDGRSFVPLLDGSAKSIRSALLIEHCRGVNRGSVPCSGLSFYAHQTRAGGYWGVITPDAKYVRYDTGDRQLFDLRSDPGELRNLIGSGGSTGLLTSMRQKLASLLRPNLQTTIVTGPWSIGTGRSRVATFTFFSPSRFSTYRCRLPRGDEPDPWHACDGGTDAVGGLTDGTYTFEVAGIDEFGHADPSPASRTFSIASSGPAVSIDEHPPVAQKTGTARFTFSSPVAGATFECRLSPVDGEAATWTACGEAADVEYSALADGDWSFEVRAKDPATHDVSSPPAEWLVRVDTTGAGFQLAKGPTDLTSDRHVSFRFVPTEGVPGPVQCRLDNRRAVDCSNGTFSASDLVKGLHTLHIVAADTLGNVAGTTFEWTVDVGPPRTRIARSPERFTMDPVASFRLWSKSDPELFLCTFDGSIEMPCDVNTTLGPLADGPHRLRVWGLDPAGNRSNPLTYRWDVDTIPPGLLLSGLPEDGAVTSDRTTAFDVWLSEPGFMFCSLDGAEFLPCATPVEYLGLADGTHTFQVYVVDRAGNVSITASRTWTVTAGV
jgi:N-acetylglucosamine-6-sulfatase